MTKVYFVRHAEPEHGFEDDRTRPLTAEGMADTNVVLNFFKDKIVDKFYCSPYKRSIDTIKSTADFFGQEIITDNRLKSFVYFLNKFNRRSSDCTDAKYCRNGNNQHRRRNQGFSEQGSCITVVAVR